uniref:Uncharacterized protein n=1 Tax=Arundo donax TaxID=35708 RepID=A0A0A9EH11_ARUDO
MWKLHANVLPIQITIIGQTCRMQCMLGAIY